MKNILAENMLRFGTKNVSESDVRTKLTEDANVIIPITLELPAIKDAKGVLQTQLEGYVKYAAINSKGTSGTSLDNYQSFTLFSFNGTAVKLSSSKKDATTGNITGMFYADKTLMPTLVKLIGKTDVTGTSGMLINVGTELVKAGPTVKLREIPATAAPK